MGLVGCWGMVVAVTAGVVIVIFWWWWWVDYWRGSAWTVDWEFSRDGDGDGDGGKSREEEELRSQWVFVLIGFREGANGVES
jgi:uncharacterized membrane protein YqiK